MDIVSSVYIPVLVLVGIMTIYIIYLLGEIAQYKCEKQRYEDLSELTYDVIRETCGGMADLRVMIEVQRRYNEGGEKNG